MDNTVWERIRSSCYKRYEAQDKDSLLVILEPTEYQALMADPAFVMGPMVGATKDMEGHLVFKYYGVTCTVVVTKSGTTNEPSDRKMPS